MAELAEPFLCKVCKAWHQTLPLSFSVQYPLAVMAVPPGEIDRRVVITADQCVLDGVQFFLRGRILLPVHELTEPFIWGVWAEVSPRNFLHTQQRWTTPLREKDPAYPGWLDTELPLYGKTLNLELQVHTQVVGRRPHFHVVDGAHPLAREQREGISRARAEEIASLLLHGSELPPGERRTVSA